MGKEFTCSECPNRAFAKSYSLRRHYRNYHPTLELPTLKQLGASKFTCEECNTRFSFHINLVRHVKKFHSTHSSPLALSLTPKKVKCKKCSAEYMSSKHLKRHECSKHTNLIGLPLIPKKYICMECCAEYTSNRNLKRHERLKHNTPVEKKLTAINCSLCSTSLTQKDDLFKHWELEHEINIETEEVELENKDMFFTWKSNIETETKSKFVRNISGFSSKSGETVYFQCNRSGYFTSKSKGLRHLKTQGTCKINGICPARMKVRVLENGKHLVQFTKTHIGHGHDLGHHIFIQNNCETSETIFPTDEILDNSSLSLPLISKKFKCMECGAEYPSNKNLKRHERLKHNSAIVKKYTLVKCSLCTTFLSQKDDLFRHWKLEHAINIETEEIELENKDVFLTWKSNIETETESKFIRNISGFSSKSGETVYFQCNRSGYFTSKSKGLRQLKTQGTCKINSICPARMKVRMLQNGKHMVQFTKTHVGHGKDLEYVSSTQNQCETLATNIPFDTILVSSSQKKFKCTVCGAEYPSNKTLKRHEYLKHSSTAVKKFTIIKCSLCSTFLTQKEDLYNHWKLEHGINIETEEIELEDKDMFLTWKNITETDTKSKFVRNMSGFSSKSGETLYFQCNRSGYFTSKSKGLRHLKTQGTCKINSICPAQMKVRILENGKHVVQFTKTHIGHGHDLGHLSLTQHQREILATKIASNIPFDAILDDIRDSIESDLPFGRIHLLTRKDLHNIKQSFNLLPNSVKPETEQDVISEFNIVEEPSSLEVNGSVSIKPEVEVASLLKSSIDSTINTPTEESCIEMMKEEVNDYYQRLSASASSRKELVVIANLLKKAKPLMDAVRLSNGESEQQFNEMASKLESDTLIINKNLIILSSTVFFLRS